MDLRQLRYFVAVAERGGFGAAASTLNVAQSALSRHVKELEHELGGPLLERGPRGVSTTEAGKVLLARGRWLLGMVEDIATEVRTESRDPSGKVRVAGPSSFAEIFYAPLARLFARKFPRVQLELGEGLTEIASDRLLRAELDIAILTDPPPNDHLAYEELVVEQVFVIGPPDDPLLKRGRLTRQAFNNLPTAIVPLSRNRFPPGIPHSIGVESSTPLKRIVASGLGYGMLPFSGMIEEVHAGSLSAALVPWMRAPRVLAVPRARPVSRATREVAAALKTICAELIASGKIVPAARDGRSGGRRRSRR